MEPNAVRPYNGRDLQPLSGGSRFPEEIMAEASKNRGMSLIQHDPSREALLSKMREKLASTPNASAILEKRGRTQRRGNTVTWGYRIGLLALVVAANYLFFGQKNTIIARLGMESVPRLPSPAATLSDDDQALYWTYALYDIGKFRSRFGVDGYYAIDQNRARTGLQELLPLVSPAVLGEISSYGPVAFRYVKAGD